jgi:hypothetical protein
MSCPLIATTFDHPQRLSAGTDTRIGPWPSETVLRLGPVGERALELREEPEHAPTLDVPPQGTHTRVSSASRSATLSLERG